LRHSVDAIADILRCNRLVSAARAEKSSVCGLLLLMFTLRWSTCGGECVMKLQMTTWPLDSVYRRLTLVSDCLLDPTSAWVLSK